MQSKKTTKHQRGAALIVSLIILLVMTVLGITAMQVTTLDEKMAGNTRDVNLAFQAAEAALREGEAYLERATLDPFNGSGGRFQPNNPSDGPLWIDPDLDWATEAAVYSGTMSGVSTAPRYIIEELPAVLTPSTGGSLAAGTPLPESGMYRVTARGTGGSDNTVVMLQSTYKR